MPHVSIRAGAALAALLTFAAAAAQDASPLRGPIALLPGPLQPLVDMRTADSGAAAGSVGAPIGWHLPGRQFRGGGGWYALVCDHGCTLHATSLGVTPAQHGVYDGEPVDSQLLHWSPLPDGLDFTQPPERRQATLVALLKPAAPLQLKPGPVVTWLHEGMETYPASGRPGTMETRIPAPGSAPVLLVPRVLPRTDDNAAPSLALELRVGRERQTLADYGFGIEGAMPVRGQDYLAWAGDLDGDGRLDLILRLGGGGTIAVLYLSTFAQPGELVGEAGRFDYFDPADAGC